MWRRNQASFYVRGLCARTRSPASSMGPDAPWPQCLRSMLETWHSPIISSHSFFYRTVTNRVLLQVVIRSWYVPFLAAVGPLSPYAAGEPP